jgi:hypothetical protein
MESKALRADSLTGIALLSFVYVTRYTKHVNIVVRVSSCGLAQQKGGTHCLRLDAWFRRLNQLTELRLKCIEGVPRLEQFSLQLI